MIKLIKELRVSNFLNLNYKLMLISLILILITVFGIKNINSAMKSSADFSEKIMTNEDKLISVYKNSSELSNTNNITLLLCLDNKYDSVSHANSVTKIRKNLNIDNNKINYKLDSLFRQKAIIYNLINNKDEDRAHLILNSNDLSLEIRLVLTEYYELKYSKNIEDYKTLKSELNYNYNKYITTIIILLILYIILFILLIKDIKVKNRLEERDSYLISTLMDKVIGEMKDETDKKI